MAVQIVILHDAHDASSIRTLGHDYAFHKMSILHNQRHQVGAESVRGFGDQF